MNKIMSLLVIVFYLIKATCFAQNAGTTKPIQKEISISPFDKVIIKGGGNIYFHYASITNIQLIGTNALIQTAEATVTDNVLHIISSPGISKDSYFAIHIYSPVIKEIHQLGGGSIVVEKGYNSLEQLRCKVDGGGTVDLASIEVNALFASIEGGGEITARVNQRLVGKINGGGQIFYYGEPKVESDINGGGVIKRK